MTRKNLLTPMHDDKTADVLIPLPKASILATLLRRIKRFTIEAEIAGKIIYAHTNNTGSMLSLIRRGRQILLSPALSPNRKLPWTLERINTGYVNDKSNWVGVNTSLPNRIFKAAFSNKLLDFAANYHECLKEVVTGDSRLDICLKGYGKPLFWVECKNVSLVEDNVASFPDAKSSRACKHIWELMERKKAGHRAAMFFFVQRADCCAFAPADYIDEEYAKLFYMAKECGVEMYAYCAEYKTSGTSLGRKLQILDKNF